MRRAIRLGVEHVEMVKDWVREALLAAFPGARVHVASAFHRYDYVIEITDPYKHMVLRVRDDTLYALDNRASVTPADVLAYMRERGVLEKLSSASVASL